MTGAADSDRRPGAEAVGGRRCLESVSLRPWGGLDPKKGTVTIATPADVSPSGQLPRAFLAFLGAQASGLMPAEK